MTVDRTTALVLQALLFTCSADILMESDEKLEEEILDIAIHLYKRCKEVFDEYPELSYIYMLKGDDNILDNPKRAKKIKEIFKTLKEKE